MPRFWIWLQLVIGWLPVWALYTTLIIAAHPPTSPGAASMLAFRAVVPAALLGLAVHRFTKRFRWPRPFRLEFLLMHVVTAALYSVSWMMLSSLLNTILQQPGATSSPRMLVPFLVLGVWLYVMVAGVSYAAQATDRAVIAEASAARAQLAALRAQLHPHFLFNALHTVVQLIPREPKRAAEAAELVAGLLRTALEEDRDLVTVADEIAFAKRYLEVESIRFGDRLRVHFEADDASANALLPSFALQTLVENAVLHGAAPRVDATEIRVGATLVGRTLRVVVSDDGDGASADAASGTVGSGLSRLRERLAALYGDRARLVCGNAPQGGFTSVLEIDDVAMDDASMAREAA
jgi:two-component system, LytTR family, sensor kinase